ncbi:hypothetical protein D3C81_1791980 [compost metagenome]
MGAGGDAQHYVQRIHGRIKSRAQDRHARLGLRKLALGLAQLVLRSQTLAVKQLNLV